jgi:hypothetical protein
MKKLVRGFVHRTGQHSVSTALRDILEFNDFKFTEEMVFGLDCGLGFMYWQSKDMVPPILIGGCANEGARLACQILGIKLEQRTAADASAAWEGLKKSIDGNEPVMLRVDLQYLDYLKRPGGMHFGRHYIVASGYDEGKGEAYVWDTRFEEAQSISLESLSKARGSAFKPFPPNYGWNVFAFPRELTKLDGAIRIAIMENAETFLDPSARNAGLRGIGYFAEQVVKWPEMLSPSDLSLTLRSCHHFIEGPVGGRGLLRRLYSKFLQETSGLLGDRPIEEAGEIIGRSADNWKLVADLLLQASEAGPKADILAHAQGKIIGCRDLEAEAFGLLGSLSKTWMEQFG